MKIAVEGCMHGDLDKVYDTFKYIENTRNIKIDLLLCYGDFQEVAPVPTIFIGGNNEASNYLWELYYGGWAAPNIYFLGYAVVVKFGNIRIDGLSGIYNARNYCLGWDTMKGHLIRSVYHVREYDVHKLMHLEKLIDIFLSHDWPLSITDYGNWQQLVCCKKTFQRSSKELLEANLLLSCSKNSDHRIDFQLTCTANSPLLLNMKRVVE
ncbi:hypothetical protein E1A91_A04G000100v1 [Gossypium mustelinum]|uniref:Calcineurin-like phosphoesterase domain-containing protein n=1 Tax=Gossypium mustelinum TaxID=34275 RepID=A0A5D2ZKB7_GOSMU|nr:hypothetical protein E1A91_A04G000100v1 [Gossypium mustelinum]